MLNDYTTTKVPEPPQLTVSGLGYRRVGGKYGVRYYGNSSRLLDLLQICFQKRVWMIGNIPQWTLS